MTSCLYDGIYSLKFRMPGYFGIASFRTLIIATSIFFSQKIE